MQNINMEEFFSYNGSIEILNSNSKGSFILSKDELKVLLNDISEGSNIIVFESKKYNKKNIMSFVKHNSDKFNMCFEYEFSYVPKLELKIKNILKILSQIDEKNLFEVHGTYDVTDLSDVYSFDFEYENKKTEEIITRRYLYNTSYKEGENAKIVEYSLEPPDDLAFDDTDTCILHFSEPILNQSFSINNYSLKRINDVILEYSDTKIN